MVSCKAIRVAIFVARYVLDVAVINPLLAFDHSDFILGRLGSEIDKLLPSSASCAFGVGGGMYGWALGKTGSGARSKFVYTG